MKLRFLAFLALASFAFPATAALFGPYAISSPVVVDGDTIGADIAIFPNLTIDADIRVSGVDTPELRGTTACERDLAMKAKAFTHDWVYAHEPLTISHVRPDKYSGRYDAVVIGRDGSLLAGALLAAGLARPYSGGARQPWCQ